MPWQLAYLFFTVAMVLVGWITYVCLRYFEKRKIKSSAATIRKNI